MILRVESEVARAALWLPLTLVPQVVRHGRRHTGAPERTSVQFDARACEQVHAALGESELVATELAVEANESEHVRQVGVQALQLERRLTRGAVRVALQPALNTLPVEDLLAVATLDGVLGD